MQRRGFWTSTGSLLLMPFGIAAARAEPPPAHRLALHVGSADPMMMGVALHNIAAEAEYFAQKGETVAIELVANGPGYTMLRADTSPVQVLLTATAKKYPFVVFSACQNTRRAVAAAEGKQPQDIPQVPQARNVPAGVARLTELQEQRYTYIRV